MNEVYVSLEFTPNPNTLKYAVNRQLVEKGGLTLTNRAEAEARSPLASKLFAVPGISAVMIGKDFVTVTKTDDGDWDVVHQQASKIIHESLSKGEKVVNDAQPLNSHKGGASVLEEKIREILDRDIRPAVAMDGGDITFEKFENGVVYVQLQGSCSGCPSSTMTLKMGIERKLQEMIPEVKEVVSV